MTRSTPKFLFSAAIALMAVLPASEALGSYTLDSVSTIAGGSTLGAGQTFQVNGSTITAAYGGTSYQFGNTTVYLINAHKDGLSVPGKVDVTYSDIYVSSSATGGGDTFTIAYSTTMNFTNITTTGSGGSVSTTGTGSATFAGTISFENITNGTGIYDATLTSGLPATVLTDGVSITLSDPFRFTPPNVNVTSPTGGVGIRLTAVPEPASMTLLGLGLGGVGLMVARRRNR